MIAERNGDQADAARVRPRLARELQDAVGGECTNGQIVVARPAEPAEVCASADDFDQKARSEFRVGSEDAGCRRIDGVGHLQRRLPHCRGRIDTLAHRESGQRSIVGVARFVEGWNVEAAFRGEEVQQVLAIDGSRNRTAKAGHEDFALAGGNHVGEQGERFRIDEGHGAADDDQRMT